MTKQMILMTALMALTLYVLTPNPILAQHPMTRPEPRESVVTEGGATGGNREPMRLRWAAATDAKVSTINGSAAVLAGGYTGAVLGERVLLGLGGYGLVTNVIVPATVFQGSQQGSLSMSYGGAVVQVFAINTPRFQVSVGALAGGGFLGYRLPLGRYGYYGTNGFAFAGDNFSNIAPNLSFQDFVFVAEPSLMATVAVTHGVRLGTTASYRSMGDVGLPGLSNTQLSGAAFGISLMYAAF